MSEIEKTWKVFRLESEAGSQDGPTDHIGSLCLVCCVRQVVWRCNVVNKRVSIYTEEDEDQTPE